MASKASGGQKRKADAQPDPRNGPKRRRAEIPVQARQAGELNIAGFVKSREFEIKALESSMQKARKGLMSRAFQQLPRNMRRRTASHNVKKIPRRLRKRAEREMKDDNTPTVSKRTKTPSRKLRLRLETAQMLKKANKRSKTVRQRKREAKSNANKTDPEYHVAVARVPRVKKYKLADPPKATSKYKRRQVNKTWLPTHLWHAKRAHMTRPTEPLWRMAIPLSPTEKSYRPSYRAAGSRGCIAWDTSYMSTIGCSGTEHTLKNMLKALGFGGEGEASSRHKRWVAGTRFIDGWGHAVDEGKRCLTPMMVLWVPEASHASESKDQSVDDERDKCVNRRRKIKLDRRIFIRVHPSAFQPFWIALLKAAKMQKPQVLVEDLRYEIGSIQIEGPSSTEALVGVLKPRYEMQAGSIESVWTCLAGIGSPASLPARCSLSFDISDPRLSHPPKQVQIPTDPKAFQQINELITTWPPDFVRSPVHLASHKRRWTASTALPSQKAIQRRVAALGKGVKLETTEQDPAIPVILLAQRSGGSSSTAQGSWTVLLPWGCTDAVWRSLIQYPLSSGGTPRFGGLNESHQIAFEHKIAWFPADMPGTEAGRAWERNEAEKRFDEWVRRPPSRRLAWDKLDLGLERKGEVGNGWSCDWDYLFTKSKRTVSTRQTELTAAAETGVETTTETRSSDAAIKKPLLPLAPGWVRKPRKQLKEATKNIDGDRQRRNTSSPEPDDKDDFSAADAVPLADYHQLTASEAGAVLRDSIDLQSRAHTLATVRIRLLSKGHPNPAARIYRLPAPEVATTTQQMDSKTVPGSGSSQSPTQSLQSRAGSLLLANPSSAIFTAESSHSDDRSLRDKWLSLVPAEFYHCKSNLPAFPKLHHNHRDLPSKHVAHAYDPPDHINVLPKNAPRSIIDEFGPEALSAEAKKQKEREALRLELMKSDFTPNDAWDASKGLVPCPDEHDLIGFATSGGYNLSEGCGTAIAGIWIQRVVQGWRDNEATLTQETTGMKGKEKQKYLKKYDQQKHLCVVRNAGESIGRLGVWQLCE